MRKILAIAAGLIILALANYTIYSREQLLAEGRMVLLQLAPVDPRSLMQGDYMALRFKAANDAFSVRPAGRRPSDGRIVLTLDERNIGTFTRIDDGTALAANEARIRYRIRNGQARLASNAFFFQEGDAKRYSTAQYGEFRVTPDGEAILTGLRDKDTLPLGAALRK